MVNDGEGASFTFDTPGILRKKSGIRHSAEFPITKIPFFGDHLLAITPIGPRSGPDRDRYN